MIWPQDFLGNWNIDIYGLINYDEKIINSFSLAQETKDFLIIAGFPKSAPLFLTFESAVNGGGERLINKNNKLGTVYHKFWAI